MPEYTGIRKSKGEAEIDAPSVYSLYDNQVEMMLFFDSFRKAVNQKRRIKFNMAGIRVISPEAILYTLSLFEVFNFNHPGFKLSGKSPADKSIHQLLIDSGFFRFVHTPGLPVSSNTNIFSIQAHANVRNDIARKLVDFAIEKLGRAYDNKAKDMYATLIECMGNAWNHAYTEEAFPKMLVRKTRLPTWKVMAFFDPKARSVHVAFVDNGKGIPETLRKNFFEILRQKVDSRVDAKLILSALNGDFRTRTEQHNRGFGLPKIFKCGKDGSLVDLRILSNYGYVLCQSDSTVNMVRKFHGTMFSWDFK